MPAIQRSAIAFARGARMGALIIRTPVAVNTASTTGELHAARAVCRRAEWRVTTLCRAGGVIPAVCAYLNRLADLLFVAARYANPAAGIPDVLWAPRESVTAFPCPAAPLGQPFFRRHGQRRTPGSKAQHQTVAGTFAAGLIQLFQHVGRHVRQHHPMAGKLILMAL